jgi:glucose-6-phosphate dehydrogenase assembly protein OpcA
VTTLWDTTGTAVVKALAAERRSGGSVTSGCALTLVIVVDESDVASAEEAAARAAQQHPLRLLMVIRRQIEAPVPRLDAEVTIGGRLGPGEAVVMRMYGRLSLHAESVVLPLLAPDAPVVTWWHGEPPVKIAYDPLGVFADRRITDCERAADPHVALGQRAEDYVPGDTDLAWTRTTLWRASLASAFDTLDATVTEGEVEGRDTDPSSLLLAGWLSSRLGVPFPVAQGRGGGLEGVSVHLSDDNMLRLRRAAGTNIVLERGTDAAPANGGQPHNAPSRAALATALDPRRDLGDLLAEELRHLDADQPYGDALGTAFGLSGLNRRATKRSHIWQDPMAPAAEPAPPAAPAPAAKATRRTGPAGTTAPRRRPPSRPRSGQADTQ